MNGLIQNVLRHAERLNSQEWALMFALVIVIGFFCLRGFGSRSSY